MSMPAKNKAKGKGKAPASVAVVEPVDTQEQEESQQQDPVSSESEEVGTCAYRSERFAMSAHHENVLVQWFSEHPEFYQKSHLKYANKPHKEKQLGTIAAQLDEPRSWQP